MIFNGFLFLCLFLFFSVPQIPEDSIFTVSDIKTTEVTFMWSYMDIWLKSGFALVMKYYFDHLKPHSLSLPVNTTQAKIVQLCPGLCYRFLLVARNPEGAQAILSPILKVETSKLQKRIAVIATKSYTFCIVWLCYYLY